MSPPWELGSNHAEKPSLINKRFFRLPLRGTRKS